MYRVELYAQVRRSVFVEGISEREAASRFGIARETVRKMLRYAAPPGYQRSKPARRPKLGPYTGIIDQILADDREQPRKQRHTAKRIHERLRDEYGFDGGYSCVKEYVREKRLTSQEMFVPLVHPPGDAQADFGEAEVSIAGVRRKAHFLVIDLPHSDDAFVKAFPAETTEAFCEGHNAAFDYFGGVPRTIVYDNTKLAVARILGDGTRQRTRAFSELESHYLFADRFGRPGKGNDKGKVEGLVGYARRNFMVPIPRFPSWEAFNEHLEKKCFERRRRRLRGHAETIAERFERDREALLPLPSAPYEACDKRPTRATSLSLVRYQTNDYSVPTRYGHREVMIKAYVDELVVCCGSEEIARHRRSYEREELIFDPLHYLALLERKTNALDQAAPLQGWELPEELMRLRRLLEVRLGKPGKREYVQVLRLLEDFSLEDVAAAARQAVELGTISFDAVKHLVLCRIEHRPPRLDLSLYPHLPAAEVERTSAADYLALLTGVG
jgi:transposase